MDHLSFSIGITQIVTPNSNRIFDYKYPKWAKNRSKSLHDPLTMAKQSSKKSKAKKEAHAKTPKKRGRKVSPAISRSALPTHIDVCFYYLRKKSKQRSMDQYRYTTVNCLFKSHINNAHTRYYNSPTDDIISTQEHIARGAAVSVHERSIINVINGFSIPAALPWHLVDKVYILVNCDEEFHWVLAVVVLRKRLIRVYDSDSGPRKKVHSGDIKKLSQILPNYLHDSGFFEKTERTDWAALDAYKDKKNGELLGPQHSFDVEFAQDIMQQESDSLDCGMFVAVFAEFLSGEINISYDSFGSDYLRKRYATLLWKYGLNKANVGYVSDNDDPPRLKSVLNPVAENELVNVG